MVVISIPNIIHPTTIKLIANEIDFNLIDIFEIQRNNIGPIICFWYTNLPNTIYSYVQYTDEYTAGCDFIELINKFRRQTRQRSNTGLASCENF